MTTKRHRARRIALHLLFSSDLTGETSPEYFADQVAYLTQEEIMVESITSELPEEEVDRRVREIEMDIERRILRWLKPRPKDPNIAELCDFALELVRGVLDFREEIDKRIRSLSEHWRLERMSIVDRNILRLGAYEVLYRPDIPPKVTIDEAVELAKEYGDEKSGSFVNGILDKLAASRLKEAETE